MNGADMAPLSAAESRPAGPLLSISLPLLRVGIVLPDVVAGLPILQSVQDHTLHHGVSPHLPSVAGEILSARSFHGLAMSVRRFLPGACSALGEGELPTEVAISSHARASGIGLHDGIARPLTVQLPLSGYKSMPPVPTCPSATSQRPTLHLSDPSLDDSVSDNIEACAPGAQHAIMKPRIPPQSLMTHDEQIDVGQVPPPVSDTHLRFTKAPQLPFHLLSHHGTCIMAGTRYQRRDAASQLPYMAVSMLGYPNAPPRPTCGQEKNVIRRGLPSAADHGV
ncbi:hypothetical protein Purlil1_6992 [Purpureocillium lilacinum]|uniref:Uncharacterized protein n=1 Tax=Purpureocillium lilacinum TaxID=33203 RepID=A0ABR0BXH6_PURLI|nr:hypothetical protein Purlil1_6992 [Purpureocillium lilacinum]